jgi:hypothetical protein
MQNSFDLFSLDGPMEKKSTNSLKASVAMFGMLVAPDKY